MAEFLSNKNSVLQTGVSDLIHPSVKFRRGSKAEKGADLFSEKTALFFTKYLEMLLLPLAIPSLYFFHKLSHLLL